MTILAVLVALLLSGISAYFSVLGLTAIFPASFWQIVVMGSALELAKIVTVVWLHRHWSQVGAFIRVYLSVAVILLMGLTPASRHKHRPSADMLPVFLDKLPSTT